MRIGLMVGSDRERQPGERLAAVIEDVRSAESGGFQSFWFPQIPGYLDAMTVISLLGQATSRIEIGSAVVPLQTRHPMALAQQALTTQMACEGRFTMGVGPSHHWIIKDQLGLPYERPAHLVRQYLEVINAAVAASDGVVDVENEMFRVHSPLDVAGDMGVPVLLAALAPMMLRIAGEMATGTILWMADERAISEHVLPRITKAASDAGRPAPRIVAAVPVALCRREDADEARQYASKFLGHAEVSPNYMRLLEHGDAADVGDVMAAGDESDVEARLRRFQEAGATDLACRVVPFGRDRAERIECRDRTRAFLSTLCPEL